MSDEAGYMMEERAEKLSRYRSDVAMSRPRVGEARARTGIGVSCISLDVNKCNLPYHVH